MSITAFALAAGLATGTAASAAAEPAADSVPARAPSGNWPKPPGKAEVIYDSIPETLPANVPSLGYQATGTSEFGDEVGFESTTHRKLKSLEIVLSSWACESGTWNTGDCETAPGATFRHPVTVNIYEVDNTGPTPEPGTLLASQTQRARIPYRPSADPVNCTGTNAGRWYDAATDTCNFGIAEAVAFDFGATTVLPDEVIWTVAFNTSGFGADPIGTGTACYASPEGCPYDVLNVGAQTFPGAPFEGIDIDPDAAFLDSAAPTSYCDGGTAGTGFLRLDAPCWTDNTPLARITATDGRKA
ncbi:hypothetical protein [Streptomyces sp. SBT349]|uniref:hypothetical protein n=1 Tax=Streptomyces sp. SBT349 TaxID=1580539 RepID=UPI00066EABC9|nr:hypothetical protein [Streptomyces sp. SBT349]